MKAKAILIPLSIGAFAVTAMADDIKSSIEVGMFESTHKAMKEVKITMVKAIEVAKTKAAGRVVKAKLDEDDGYLIYEIKLIDSSGNDTEVKIDPVTAIVLDIDKDD
jgi:uncharacterized membrane protein YkoI